MPSGSKLSTHWHAFGAQHDGHALDDEIQYSKCVLRVCHLLTNDPNKRQKAQWKTAMYPSSSSHRRLALHHARMFFFCSKFSSSIFRKADLTRSNNKMFCKHSRVCDTNYTEFASYIALFFSPPSTRFMSTRCTLCTHTHPFRSDGRNFVASFVCIFVQQSDFSSRILFFSNHK